MVVFFRGLCPTHEKTDQSSDDVDSSACVVHSGRQGSTGDLRQGDQAKTRIRLKGSLIGDHKSFGDSLGGDISLEGVLPRDIRQRFTWGDKGAREYRDNDRNVNLFSQLL